MYYYYLCLSVCRSPVVSVTLSYTQPITLPTRYGRLAVCPLRTGRPLWPVTQYAHWECQPLVTLLTPLKLLSFPSYDHTPAAIFRRHCFPWHNIYSEICNILTPLSQLECSSNSIVIGNQCTTILLLCGSHITTLYHPPSLHHPLSLHHPPSITLSLSITLPLSPSLSPSPSLYHPLSLHHPPSITLSLSWVTSTH